MFIIYRNLDSDCRGNDSLHIGFSQFIPALFPIDI